MFTGIVSEIGQVRQITGDGDVKIRIGCTSALASADIGASIACNGVCLTVIAAGAESFGGWFEVSASAETKAKTTLAGGGVGTPANLERALRLGDELGGHIVSGHVDGLAEIVDMHAEGDSHRLSLRAPGALGRFIAPKGSVTLDGISLTVNEVQDTDGHTVFGVNIIPHTWTATNLSTATVGRQLNLEIDLMARYVARLAEAG